MGPVGEHLPGQSPAPLGVLVPQVRDGSDGDKGQHGQPVGLRKAHDQPADEDQAVAEQARERRLDGRHHHVQVVRQPRDEVPRFGPVEVCHVLGQYFLQEGVPDGELQPARDKGEDRRVQRRDGPLDDHEHDVDEDVVDEARLVVVGVSSSVVVVVVPVVGNRYDLVDDLSLELRQEESRQAGKGQQRKARHQPGPLGPAGHRDRSLDVLGGGEGGLGPDPAVSPQNALPDHGGIVAAAALEANIKVAEGAPVAMADGGVAIDIAIAVAVDRDAPRR
mmetsp:Transcript_14643/g.30334  ORF Transcript_14643/g.30334 Transcript_14643/m.30334 type:complete len:277 (-) Transcript_14643:646-1476(-)